MSCQKCRCLPSKRHVNTHTTQTQTQRRSFCFFPCPFVFLRFPMARSDVQRTLLAVDPCRERSNRQNPCRRLNRVSNVRFGRHRTHAHTKRQIPTHTPKHRKCENITSASNEADRTSRHINAQQDTHHPPLFGGLESSKKHMEQM